MSVVDTETAVFSYFPPSSLVYRRTSVNFDDSECVRASEGSHFHKLRGKFEWTLAHVHCRSSLICQQRACSPRAHAMIISHTWCACASVLRHKSALTVAAARTHMTTACARARVSVPSVAYVVERSPRPSCTRFSPSNHDNTH